MQNSNTIRLSSDPVKAEFIQRMGPLPLEARRLAPFQSRVQAIIHQQLNGNATETLLNRFKG